MSFVAVIYFVLLHEELFGGPGSSDVTKAPHSVTYLPGFAFAVPTRNIRQSAGFHSFFAKHSTHEFQKKKTQYPYTQTLSVDRGFMLAIENQINSSSDEKEHQIRCMFEFFN